VRALLLAAGLGTRLRPITDKIPKCLVLIQGKPLLEIWLDKLCEAGVQEFLVNTHYLAAQVEEFISNSRYQQVVSMVNESNLLGTAGTLHENIDFFRGQDGMLIHADNFCLADFGAFQQAHQNRPAECLVTMMTFDTDTPSLCGIIEQDERGVVIGFHEKVDHPPGNLANGAIYLLSSDFFQILATEFREASCFSTQILPKLMGRIYTYKTNAPLIDIGSPEAYEKANQLN